MDDLKKIPLAKFANANQDFTIEDYLTYKKSSWLGRKIRVFLWKLTGKGNVSAKKIETIMENIGVVTASRIHAACKKQLKSQGVDLKKASIDSAFINWSKHDKDDPIQALFQATKYKFELKLKQVVGDFPLTTETIFSKAKKTLLKGSGIVWQARRDLIWAPTQYRTIIDGKETKPWELFSIDEELNQKIDDEVNQKGVNKSTETEEGIKNMEKQIVPFFKEENRNRALILLTQGGTRTYVYRHLLNEIDLISLEGQKSFHLKEETCKIEFIREENKEYLRFRLGYRMKNINSTGVDEPTFNISATCNLSNPEEKVTLELHI